MTIRTPQDGGFWDAKYEGEGYAYGEAPNAWLRAQTERLPEHARVLVPGDGEGRNGAFLATRGYRVTTIDLSPRGVVKAKRLAHRMGVGIDAHVADLFEWDWGEAAWDAVALVFVHLPPEKRARLHALAAAALAPGGVLIVEGFTPDHLPLREANPAAGGPGRADMLLTEAILRDDLAGLRPLMVEQGRTRLAEGPLHQGEADTVRAVFQRPR